MSVELSRAIAAAVAEAHLSSSGATKLRQKLSSAFVELLPSLNLEAVRHLSVGGHGPAIDDVIRDMTLAQLKKLSKAWNPHRKLPKEPIMRDVQIEIRDLVTGKVAPTPAPPKPPAKKFAKTRSAAGVAAE